MLRRVTNCVEKLRGAYGAKTGEKGGQIQAIAVTPPLFCRVSFARSGKAFSRLGPLANRHPGKPSVAVPLLGEEATRGWRILVKQEIAWTPGSG